MPFMPALDGHFQTHNTYRFVTVREQVLTVIGEAKHGMWRIQDNGLVRLYRKFGTTGVPIGADVYDPSLQAAITSDYKPVLIPGLETGDMIGGWAGYRYSQDADGDGQAAFVDIHIYHPYFKSSYDNHPVIDPGLLDLLLQLHSVLKNLLLNTAGFGSTSIPQGVPVVYRIIYKLIAV